MMSWWGLVIFLLHNKNLYSAIPQNELTSLYKFKSTKGQLVQKHRETIKKKMYYIYTYKFDFFYVYKQPTKWKQQHLTDKDTTSKLKHPKALKLTKSKTVFFHSVYKHSNHTANVVQYTHTGRNLILLKGGEQEVCFWLGFKRWQKMSRGRVWKVVNFQQVEPGIGKFVHQHFSDWPLGWSEGFEKKNEEIWRMSIRTDSRGGKVVCHQNTRMRVASLKTVPSETGS